MEENIQSEEFLKRIANNIKVFFDTYAGIAQEEAQDILNKIIGQEWLGKLLSNIDIHKQIFMLPYEEFIDIKLILRDSLMYEAQYTHEIPHINELNKSLINNISKIDNQDQSEYFILPNMSLFIGDINNFFLEYLSVLSVDVVRNINQTNLSILAFIYDQLLNNEMDDDLLLYISQCIKRQCIAQYTLYRNGDIEEAEFIEFAKWSLQELEKTILLMKKIREIFKDSLMR